MLIGQKAYRCKVTLPSKNASGYKAVDEHRKRIT